MREAVRAALRANDEGKPDDGLLSALIGGFGVANAERLTRKVNDEPTAQLGASLSDGICRRPRRLSARRAGDLKGRLGARRAG